MYTHAKINMNMLHLALRIKVLIGFTLQGLALVLKKKLHFLSKDTGRRRETAERRVVFIFPCEHPQSYESSFLPMRQKKKGKLRTDYLKKLMVVQKCVTES